ncbi:MAG: DUF3488 and transglutaminase-like domain-containing protein [Planctomycetaceae bacterium]
MKLSQVFQYSIYIQVLLSSLIYGLAEEAVLPAGLTLPIALFCLYVIDARGQLRIPQWVADGLGIVAFIFAGMEFFSDRPAAKLLAGSHLLIYLTWVVLIQEKSVQQYWRLIALATLQVAVAAVLTSAPQFGLLLVIYVFFSLWTLSVYSMYRAELRFTQAELSPTSQFGAPSTAAAAGKKGIRPTNGAAAAIPKSESGRAVSGIFAPSFTRGTIQHDPDQRWINSRFVLGTFATANMSIVVGTIFFMLIPRLWFGRWSALADAPLSGGSTLTGYNEDVELGSSGEIQESTQPVMRVKLTRAGDDAPIDVEEYTERLGYSEPMFRGSVLCQYGNARWRPEPGSSSVRAMDEANVPYDVIQDYHLEPIGTSVLFHIPPVISGSLSRTSGRIRQHRRTGVLIRPSVQQSNELLRYKMYSAWPKVPVSGRPAEALSENLTEMIINQFNQNARRNYWAIYLHVPPQLSRLTELAHRVAYRGGSGNDVPPRVRADRIEEFLRNSGEYTYSLKSTISNDDVDPIEDFLFYRKQGDCKYYATALALMLRAVDVPTRVVNGFKGGAKNEETGEFMVQQRHAHTWVEVLIVDEGSDTSLPRLNWVVYDATPAARDENLDALIDDESVWESVVKTARDAWSNYIVQMSLARQTQDIYAPIQSSVREWWQGAGGARGVLARAGSGLVHFLKHPDQWVSWKGGLIAFCLMVSLLGTFWLGKRILRLVNRLWRNHGDRKNAQSIRIEFYEKFLALLSRHGWKRSPAQTQREFAEEFIEEFQRRFPEKSLGEMPRSITTSFYQCRFGMQPLSDTEIQAMEQDLTQLERVLAQPADGNGRR